MQVRFSIKFLLSLVFFANLLKVETNHASNKYVSNKNTFTSQNIAIATAAVLAGTYLNHIGSVNSLYLEIEKYLKDLETAQFDSLAQISQVKAKLGAFQDFLANRIGARTSIKNYFRSFYTQDYLGATKIELDKILKNVLEESIILKNRLEESIILKNRSKESIILKSPLKELIELELIYLSQEHDTIKALRQQFIEQVCSTNFMVSWSCDTRAVSLYFDLTLAQLYILNKKEKELKQKLETESLVAKFQQKLAEPATQSELAELDTLVYADKGQEVL